jgi:hypothetical protein
MHYSFRFLLATLAVWRVTHFLAKEDGPWSLVVRLRRALGRGFTGNLVSCFYCLSIWIAIPFSFFLEGSAMERVVVWLALSGAASLLERMTGESLDIRIEDK